MKEATIERIKMMEKSKGYKVIKTEKSAVHVKTMISKSIRHFEVYEDIFKIVEVGDNFGLLHKNKRDDTSGYHIQGNSGIFTSIDKLLNFMAQHEKKYGRKPYNTFKEVQ